MAPQSPLSNELNFPWPFPKEPSRFYQIKSKVTLTFVYFCSKMMFCGLNKLIVKNKQTFIDALEDRSRPLITISNHRSNVDDPLFWSILSIREFFRNMDRFRYTLAAHNICFTRPLHTSLFSLGRCVPCVRGAGVFQTGVDFCVDALSKNGWVHMFPEGKVTKLPIRIKWGISRLIAEPKTAPILLPIWLNGMQNVWPDQAPYYPKVGKVVEITVGNPIDTRDLLKNLKGQTELDRRKEIADLVQAALFDLGKTQLSS
ncbi:acyltransferase domain-containing protein [Ditylenchus destructor]|uniref:Tafazzin family protein n=1 Tax=Ditylenchus destructor TaxID=166010 RepID=A0AAD4R7U6_9BILA|nr:acyltransferase domain-containing protein [Ditylenchus destructor]